MLMSNLFSIFDPSMSIFSSYWTGLLFTLSVMPSFLFIKSKMFMILKKLFNFFKMEVGYTFSKSFYLNGVFSFFISLIMFIFIMNFLALFPYFFSTTSHLMITLPISYSLWIGVILINLNHFFKDYILHFIPLGTPMMLMSFMSIVEFLSNLIRPLALTFRLTANMMAGHLLMSLILGFIQSLNMIIFLFGYSIQMFLTIMEMGVSFIQAYVFFTLLLLYLSEGSF